MDVRGACGVEESAWRGCVRLEPAQTTSTDEVE